MTNVLVAGGAGFLGKNLVRHWRRRHPDGAIVAFDTLRRHRADAPGLEATPGVTVVEGNANDTGLVEHTLRSASIDVVVNLASTASVDLVAHDPRSAVTANVASAVSLLEASRRVGRIRFHQVSSAEVFGTGGGETLLAEDLAYAPRTAYGASKAAADHFVRSYSESYGLASTISIAPNTYGPFQRPDQALPRFITTAILGAPLPIYGTGEHSREWLHVDDHCAGIAAVIERGQPGRVYNLGSADVRTVTEMAVAVLDVLGRPRSLVRHLPDRPGHASRPPLDWSRARRELGWCPSVALDDGIRATAAWYLANQPWWSVAGDQPPAEVA